MRNLVDSWAPMHAYLVLRASIFFNAAGLSALSVTFAWHGGFQLQFQLFRAFFHGVLELHVIWIEVLNSSHILSTVELLLFNNPMLLFFFVESFSTCSTKLLAMSDRAWMLLELLLIFSLDHVSPFGGFFC